MASAAATVEGRQNRPSRAEQEKADLERAMALSKEVQEEQDRADATLQAALRASAEQASRKPLGKLADALEHSARAREGDDDDLRAAIAASMLSAAQEPPLPPPAEAPSPPTTTMQGAPQRVPKSRGGGSESLGAAAAAEGFQLLGGEPDESREEVVLVKEARWVDVQDAGWGVVTVKGAPPTAEASAAAPPTTAGEDSDWTLVR